MWTRGHVGRIPQSRYPGDGRSPQGSGERGRRQHVETYEDLGDNLEARVLRTAEDRRKLATIAKALPLRLTREGKPAVTHQEVRTILKDARDPAVGPA